VDREIPDHAIVFEDPNRFGGPNMSAGDLDADGDHDLVVPGFNGISVFQASKIVFFGPQSSSDQPGTVVIPHVLGRLSSQLSDG
jgi:hypothetical protein